MLRKNDTFVCKLYSKSIFSHCIYTTNTVHIVLCFESYAHRPLAHIGIAFVWTQSLTKPRFKLNIIIWSIMKKIIIVCNLIVIISLVFSYIYLFGYHSLEKYLEKDVIIIKHEESPATITAPGLVVKLSYRY